ncbi:uncharacterized protein LOC143275251 [Babylonia areolata]|uniref:uncharacterized protein LOC143275251 n=1 Tax=Babylonia areolata TaxID=304850 RepID=UPI003FD6A054
MRSSKGLFMIQRLFSPTEPYLKRFQSSTTGGESVVVIFANNNNDNDNDREDITNDTHIVQSQLAGLRHTPAAGASGVDARKNANMRVREIPFSAEKQFDVNGNVFRRLDSPSSLTTATEEIPPGILQMLTTDEDDDNDGDRASNSSGSSRLGQRGSVRASHTAANFSQPRQGLNPLLARKRAGPSLQPGGARSDGRRVPDWVYSLFFSGGAGGSPAAAASSPPADDKEDVMFSDLIDIDERQRTEETGSDQTELNGEAPEPEKLGKHDLVHRGDKNEMGLSMESDIDVDGQRSEGSLIPKQAQQESKAKQQLLSSNSVKRGVADHRMVNTQTGALDLSGPLDPDEPYHAWDFPPDPLDPDSSQHVNQPSVRSSSLSADNRAAGSETPTETERQELGEISPHSRDTDFASDKASLGVSQLSQHTDLTGKLLSAARTADKSKVEHVGHKSPLTLHENKQVKKLLHKTVDALAMNPAVPPQASSKPDAQQHVSFDTADKAGDKIFDKYHGHKMMTDKSKNTTSALNETKTEQKPSQYPDLKIQNSKSDVNLTLWKNVLKERKRLLRAKCQDSTLILKQHIQEARAIVDRKRNVMYCPVAKSASGFFHRLMFTFKHTNRSAKDLPSPFDVPLSTALAEDFDTIRRFHRKGFEEFMENSLRFLVVRDPFSRLFAAYVDRLLVPDSVFWKQWGIPAITKHRKYPSPKSLACGNDVTFAEFVKYVIDTLHDSDDTVKPVSSLCAPCELRFSIIGHVDTLVSDIEYILSLLKLSLANFSADTFMTDVNDDIISDSTVRAFQSYEELKSCISKYEMGKRLWRNLQIHGIISEELTFSFAPKKVDRMTPEEFVKIVQDARKTLPDSEKVRQQKFEALKTAFEKVPAEDIMQIVKIYALDFEFFGYDRHPSFVS